MHVIVTRLWMVKFVYAERLALHFLDIFFTHLCKRIKNNELKVDSIINPTPVYLIFFLCMGWENGFPAAANVSSHKLENL